MASTSRRPLTGRTSLFLLALATMASAQTMVSEGCYSSVTPLKNQGPWTYQSSGYCQKECVALNKPVFALAKGSLCYCGDMLPAASSKTSTSACNVPCQGFPDEMCGGNNAFTVWLTGTEESVPVYGSSGTSGSGTSASTSTFDTVNAQPTKVTSVVQGTTIIKTVNGPAASSTGNSSSGSSSGGGGTSVAGIAAGVVVGVLAMIAIVAGIYFYLRHRKNKAAEDEYKRTQVSDFMRGGESKPPGTGYSQMSDSRLDPNAGARRNSHGSIADNQDYSRRILRVANPDDS